MPAGKKIEYPEENPGTKKLTGTFTVPPPLCIGEPFNDKRIMDGRYKGKAFGAGYFKSDERTRVCAPGTFKLSPFLTSNDDMKGKDPYNEGIKYKDIFKSGDKRPSGAPKQGFLSGDFPKRDEYTNNMRTEQLRETLKRENKIHQLIRAKTANLETSEQSLKVVGGEHLPMGCNLCCSQTYGMRKVNLFDLVFRMPQPSFRLKRDDRQGKFFYMAERRKQQQEDSGNVKKKRPDEGKRWVSVGLPNGKEFEVLVESNKIIATKRPSTAHI
mmetsp:Transcript_41365/g.130188  ORF Transcript_41365/g.130188 Transcript_41365/m.130188 type:complete len:270 (-) Transcript_41365:347-1156(-)